MPPSRFNEEDGLESLIDRATRDFGLSGTMPPEVLQFPTAENDFTTIVRVGLIVNGREGGGQMRTYWALGDASPKNIRSQEVAKRAVVMAESRAWARALRMITNNSHESAAPRRLQDTTQAQSSDSPGVKRITKEQWATITELGKALGMTDEQTVADVKKLLRIERINQATEHQADQVIEAMRQSVMVKTQPSQAALPTGTQPIDEGPPPEDSPVQELTKAQRSDLARKEINMTLSKLNKIRKPMRPPGPRASIEEMTAWLKEANDVLAAEAKALAEDK